MATKKTQIQIKRNTNTNYNPGTITLREGEPFYNKPTEDFYIGNGLTPINRLIPINVKPVVAVHSYQSRVHIFTIDNYVGDLEVLPVISEFTASYGVGENVKLKLKDMNSPSGYTEYSCDVATIQGRGLPDNGFVAHTVSEFFIKLDTIPQLFFIVGGDGGDIPEREYQLLYEKNGQDNVSNMPANSTFRNTQPSVQINSSGKTPIDNSDRFVCTGWTRTPNGEKVYPLTGGVINPTPNYDVTLYAFWEDKIRGSYQISYLAGYTSDGTLGPLETDTVSNVPREQQFSVDEDATLSNETPRCNGYTFDGWKLNGTKYTPGQVYRGREDTNFTASWTRDTYTVHYYVNGVQQGSPISRLFRDSITLSNVPAQSGKTALGWSLNGAGVFSAGSTVNIPYSATRIIRFDAVYSDSPITTQYRVHYDGNGGTYSPIIPDANYPAGTTVSINFTNQPRLSGKAFKGYLAPDECGEDILYTSGGLTSFTITADTNLVAQWKTQYTITYNMNGGTGTIASQTQNEGEYTTLSTIEPTKTDYKFLGWGLNSTDTTATYTKGQSVPFGADTTLYAIWERLIYKYTYTSEYGTAPAGSTTNNIQKIVLSVPTDTMRNVAGDNNKRFNGWKLNGGGIYSAGSEVTLNAGTNTLQATFTPFDAVKSGAAGSEIEITFEDESIEHYALVYHTGDNNPVTIDCHCDDEFVAKISPTATTGSYAVYVFRTECEEYYIKILVSGGSKTYRLTFNSNGLGTPPQAYSGTRQSYTLPGATTSMRVAGAEASVPKICTGWKVNNVSYSIGSNIALNEGDNTAIAVFEPITLVQNMSAGSTSTIEYASGATNFVEYDSNGCANDIISDIHFDDVNEEISITTESTAEPGNWIIYKFTIGESGDESTLIIKITGETTFRLTFNLMNHGDESRYPAQTVAAGSTATAVPDPTDSAFAFRGWYKDSSYNTVWSWATTFTTNITIYAKWDAGLLVQWFEDEGDDNPFDQRTVGRNTTTYNPIRIPWKRGERFKGWKYDSETELYLPGTDFPARGGVTQDSNLYAQFENTSKYHVYYAMREVQGTKPAGEGEHTSSAFTVPYPTDSMKTVADRDQEAIISWKYNNVAVRQFGASITLINGDNQFEPQYAEYDNKIGLQIAGPSYNYTQSGGINSMKELYTKGTSNAFTFEEHFDCEDEDECAEPYIVCQCNSNAQVGDYAVLKISGNSGTKYVKFYAIENDTMWDLTYISDYGTPPAPERYPHNAEVIIKDATSTMTSAAQSAGLVFYYWEVDGECEDEWTAGDVFHIKENIILRAHFDVPTYRASFSSSYGTAPTAISGNKTITLPAQTSSMRDGANTANKVFIGWGEDPSCDDAIKPGEAYTLAVSNPQQTLYAIFADLTTTKSMATGDEGSIEVNKPVKSIDELAKKSSGTPITSINYVSECEEIQYKVASSGISTGDYVVYNITYNDDSQERIRFLVTAIAYKYQYSIKHYDTSMETLRTQTNNNLLELPDITDRAHKAAIAAGEVFDKSWQFNGVKRSVGTSVALTTGTTNTITANFDTIEDIVEIYTDETYIDNTESYSSAIVLYGFTECTQVPTVSINSNNNLVISAPNSNVDDYVIVKALTSCAEFVKKYVVSERPVYTYKYQYKVNGYDTSMESVVETSSSSIQLRDNVTDKANRAAAANDTVFDGYWRIGTATKPSGTTIPLTFGTTTVINANFRLIDREQEVVDGGSYVDNSGATYTSAEVLFGYTDCEELPTVTIDGDGRLTVTASDNDVGDYVIVHTSSDCDADLIQRITVIERPADTYTYKYNVSGYDTSFEVEHTNSGSSLTLANCSSRAAAKAVVTYNKVFTGWTFNGRSYNAGDTITLPANVVNTITANFANITKEDTIYNGDSKRYEDQNYTSITDMYCSSEDAPEFKFAEDCDAHIVIDAECAEPGDIRVALVKWDGGQAYWKATADEC